MKRAGLHRTGRLKRTKGLDANGQLKRTAGLKRTTPLRVRKVKHRPRIPASVRAAAKMRSQGLCIVCRSHAATQLHHVLPYDDWPQYLKVVANLVGVCAGCHYAHEFPGVKDTRIPRAALPPMTIAWAVAVGAGWYIDKTYPRDDWRWRKDRAAGW